MHVAAHALDDGANKGGFGYQFSGLANLAKDSGVFFLIGARRILFIVAGTVPYMTSTFMIG